MALDLGRRTIRRRQAEPADDEDVYGGGPPAASNDDDEPKPLGVREDYRVPRPVVATGRSRGWGHPFPGGTTITAQAPLYFEGDQLLPVGTSPANITRLQGSLAAAGLLTNFDLGVWDLPSQEAYAALLSEANVAGVTWEAQLSKRAKAVSFGGRQGGSGQGSGGGGGGHWEFDENGEPVWVADQYQRPPLELRTTNKDDLKRAFRTAVIDKMGEGWSQAQIDEMVDAYNWQEIKVQSENYNQQVALEEAAFGGVDVGGRVITQQEAPSPETFVEGEMMRRDPVGFQAGGVINEALPQFIQALKGWV